MAFSYRKAIRRAGPQAAHVPRLLPVNKPTCIYRLLAVYAKWTEPNTELYPTNWWFVNRNFIAFSSIDWLICIIISSFPLWLQTPNPGSQNQHSWMLRLTPQSASDNVPERKQAFCIVRLVRGGNE